MKKLQRILQSYAGYHRDFRNVLTHLVGVPLVTLSLFIPMTKLTFFQIQSFPISLATCVWVGLTLYYVSLDRILGVSTSLLLLALVAIAETLRSWSPQAVLWGFIISFVLGWAFQLLGHWFEGKRPALFDNLAQVFTAPLFIVVEVCFLLGFYSQLKKSISQS